MESGLRFCLAGRFCFCLSEKMLLGVRARMAMGIYSGVGARHRLAFDVNQAMLTFRAEGAPLY